MATKSASFESDQAWEQVRRAPDYRAFLQAYIDVRSLKLSDLARAAGFGRGFPGDVISGKRRLTAQSCHAFERAMKLPLSGRKLFRALVAFEESDLFPEVDRGKLAEAIAHLRTRSWLRQRRELQEGTSPSVEGLLRDPKMVSIYAAAGTPGEGASFDEIQMRTRLPAIQLRPALSRMFETGMVAFSHESGKFVPQDLHLFLKGGAGNELLIGSFQNAARAAAERVVDGAGSESEFFFSSQFCIREECLPELKKALRETILKFVDDSIEADGDRVVKLLTALHR